MASSDYAMEVFSFPLAVMGCNKMRIEAAIIRDFTKATLRSQFPEQALFIDLQPYELKLQLGGKSATREYLYNAHCACRRKVCSIRGFPLFL